MVKFKNLKSKPYIIAEIGINHNGYYEIAKTNSTIKKGWSGRCKISKRDVEDLVNYNTSPGFSKGYLSKNEYDTKKIQNLVPGSILILD